MKRKQSQDDEIGQGANGYTNFVNKIQKLETKSQKMYDNIGEVIAKTIQAINQTQQNLMKEQTNFGSSLQGLHVKMTEIKPLKSIKDQYNDFYKKLSGFGKSLEQLPMQNGRKLNSPKLFDEKDINFIQKCISDHYLSKKQYEAAESIVPDNHKKMLFVECFQIRNQILQGKFDKAAQWAQRINPNDDQLHVGYQIHKMKVICLVKQNKADEAIAYLRKNLASYSQQYGAQMSKLMSFIITQSSDYWGSQPIYSGIYKNRYNVFSSISLQQLAQKFTLVYSKINKLFLISPVKQCYDIGLKYRQQFFEQLKYLPQSQELPSTLPFSIMTGSEHKYHSYFYCPVNKQVFNSTDKNVVLNCGHMVSHSAISKITQGKDSRRKMRCPICQSDQLIQSNLKVQF